MQIRWDTQKKRKKENFSCKGFIWLLATECRRPFVASTYFIYPPHKLINCHFDFKKLKRMLGQFHWFQRKFWQICLTGMPNYCWKMIKTWVLLTQDKWQNRKGNVLVGLFNVTDIRLTLWLFLTALFLVFLVDTHQNRLLPFTSRKTWKEKLFYFI